MVDQAEVTGLGGPQGLAPVCARLQAIERIKGTLKSADDPASGATPAPAQQTNTQLENLQAEMNACQSVLLEARTLGDEIRSTRENVLKFRLLGRGPDIWSVALASVQQANSLPGVVRAFLDDRLQVKRLQSQKWILLGGCRRSPSRWACGGVAGGGG